MKRSMMMAAITASALFTACAQKIKSANLPSVVKDGFAKKFPGVSAKWEKEDGNYEAEFKQGGKESSALFTAAGNLTETEVTIETSALPAAVAPYIYQKYRGKKVKEAAMITMADGSVYFEAEIKGMDIIFDNAGTFVREVKH